MPDIQEAKWFEFTVQILPPLRKQGSPPGGKKNWPPLDLFHYIRPSFNKTETRNKRLEALKYKYPRARLQISKHELERSSQGQRSGGNILNFVLSENCNIIYVLFWSLLQNSSKMEEKRLYLIENF